MSDLLRDMSVFVAIARLQSFTKAAESIGLPISSLSRRMRDFEKHVGIQLITRNTRRLELTALGKEYFAECERIVAEAETAHERLMGQRADIRGLVRLSMTPDFGAVLFRPLLSEFADTHPQLTFDLDLTPNFSDMITGNIDVSIRFGQPQDSGLTMRTLGHIRHALYATTGYLAEHGTPAHPDDLQHHQGICIRHAGKTPRRTVQYNGMVVQLQLQERFSCNHLSMILNLALAGHGVAVLPEVFARPYASDGRLVTLLPAWQFPEVPVFALTASKLLPARVRTLLDFLIARVPSIL